jgi:FHA domain
MAAQAARLIVLEPPELHGRAIALSDGWTTIGRDQVDVCLDDPYVSRRHAGLFTGDGYAVVEDFASRSGTTINDRRIDGRQTVSPGDIVGFGRVRARFEVGSAQAPTQTFPPSPSPPTASATFGVGTQTAGSLNNVGRDQYNSYLQTVVHERESFLREVAASRTRARYLITIGLIVFLGATAVGIVAAVLTERRISSANADTNPDAVFKTFDVAYIAAGVSAFGIILTIIGIILHVVATSRQRRVNERFPVHPPW